MTQRTTTRPTFQSFNRLLEAVDAQEILDALIQCCWEAQGIEGEPPLVTVESFHAFMKRYRDEIEPTLDSREDPRPVEPPSEEPEIWHAKAWFWMKRCIQTHRKEKTSLSWDPEMRLLYVEKLNAIDDWEDPTNHAEMEELLRQYGPTIFNDDTAQLRSEAQKSLLTLPYLKLKIQPRENAEKIERIHQLWIEAREFDETIKHPLAPIVKEWLTEQTHRTIKTATVDHVRDLTTIPYTVSEVNRRKWQPIGSVDAVEVDGEPIITQISQLPGPFSDDYPGRAKVYKPKGTQGDLMPMPSQRDHMNIPIPLVAYQRFGDNLRSSIAPDVAQLMTLAYAANEPLILSVKEGASLLARGQDGQLGRQVNPADEQRFNIAFACVHGMAGWVTDDRGVNQFYPLTACDRFSDDRVSIAAASWARDRTRGRWTLTAGFGVAGQNRLKGNTHNNNVWRFITGVEYWLARERFAAKGTYQGTSQALIPANGTTGPGNWYTLTWQELMIIAGDLWEQSNRQAYKRAHKRFQKVRDALIQHGYQVKNLNTPAPAGDTVEFLFGKDGLVMVRTTERFVEGGRKAKRQDWQTVNLTDFLGF